MSEMSWVPNQPERKASNHTQFSNHGPVQEQDHNRQNNDIGQRMEVENEIDPRIQKLQTLKESQLKKTVLSGFVMKLMKDAIRTRENDDFETFDAQDWDNYYKEMDIMFNE